MALTNESMDLSEQASVERQETDAILADPDTMAAIREGEAELIAGNRRADFPVGSYVRTRTPMIDPDVQIDIENEARPFDIGQVRDDGQSEGTEFVSVRWSQAGCGCGAPAQEKPADLVAITEPEYLMTLAAYYSGYNNGYDAATEV